MNDIPPNDDAADDVEALYRRISAQNPSKPGRGTRQAILEHSARVASNRSPSTAIPPPKWRRPVFVGSLAAAALAGLLVGPQFLRGPIPPPAAQHMVPASAVTAPALTEPSAPAARAAAKSEPAPTATNFSATRPLPRVHVVATSMAPRAAAAAANADGAASEPGKSAANGQLAEVTTTVGDERVVVTGARIQRPPASLAALEEARTSSAAAVRDSGAASIDARDSDGRTALMRAVRQDHLDTVAELLRRGADPNAADNNGITPLQAARARNEANITDALVRAGARQ
jgi:hypothetical protein